MNKEHMIKKAIIAYLMSRAEAGVDVNDEEYLEAVTSQIFRSIQGKIK